MTVPFGSKLIKGPGPQWSRAALRLASTYQHASKLGVTQGESRVDDLGEVGSVRRSTLGIPAKNKAGPLPCLKLDPIVSEFFF
jgi:hypothetical protein